LGFRIVEYSARVANIDSGLTYKRRWFYHEYTTTCTSYSSSMYPIRLWMMGVCYFEYCEYNEEDTYLHSTGVVDSIDSWDAW
jgi:hypothetical protein